MLPVRKLVLIVLGRSHKSKRKKKFQKAWLPLENGGELVALYWFVFLYISAHGLRVWSVDEKSIIVNLDNDVIEAHHKGGEGHHHFYTGKLVYMGKMKKEIKLETIGGEKMFPLNWPSAAHGD